MTIGPSIEEGFYYDFDTPRPFTPEDLEKIEDSHERDREKQLALSENITAKRRSNPFFRGKR